MFHSKDPIAFGVIGLGQFGFALAKKLAESGEDCIVIDSDESKIQAIRSYTDYAFVARDLGKDTLVATGINHCDAVAVCIGEKLDTSILVTLNLIKLGVPRVICKAVSEEHAQVLERLGAEVVFPEQEMAVRVARRIVGSTDFIDHLSLKSQVEVTKIKVTEPLRGIKIRDLHIRQNYSLNIIALEIDGETIIEVNPDYMLAKGDTLVILGKQEGLTRLENDLVTKKFQLLQRGQHNS